MALPLGMEKRTITISVDTWRALSHLKLRLGLHSFTEAIEFLFDRMKDGGSPE